MSKLRELVKNREARMLESMGSQRVSLPVYPYSGIEFNRKKGSKISVLGKLRLMEKTEDDANKWSIAPCSGTKEPILLK